ncbi:hypothetical protein [Owenweeksia hongkongensis]|uniref:hypothetical protein n=1 Tax=Owenweeksia hongkongensis TaxID=253245 RepID=UPI003A9413F3
MNRKGKILLTFGALLFVVSSCYNDNKEDIYQNANNDCDTSNVTYSATIKAIVTANCAISGCHSGTNPSANLDYTTYADLETSASNGALVNRINGRGALMPQGGPALPECQITQIETWVNDGAPNN